MPQWRFGKEIAFSADTQIRFPNQGQNLVNWGTSGQGGPDPVAEVGFSWSDHVNAAIQSTRIKSHRQNGISGFEQSTG